MLLLSLADIVKQLRPQTDCSKRDILNSLPSSTLMIKVSKPFTFFFPTAFFVENQFSLRMTNRNTKRLAVELDALVEDHLITELPVEGKFLFEVRNFYADGPETG